VGIVLALLAAALGMLPALQFAYADTGGPDALGYVYMDSNETGGPTYNFEDISATGTRVPCAFGPAHLDEHDDAVSDAIPIGFTFDYYDTGYTEIYVSSNGFLTVLSGHSGRHGLPLPSLDNPDGVIAGWWEDLNPEEGGTIYCQTKGSAPNQYFIVQFEEVQHFPNGNAVTFQFKLFESTRVIEVHYQAAPSDGGTHSAGIENQDGTVGLQYYIGTSGLTTPLAVRYVPPLVKTVDDATPLPGQRITYTLSVCNNITTTTLTGAVISDTLPGGLTLAGPVTLDPPQPGATLADDAGDLPTLASGLTITVSTRITLTFPVTVSAGLAIGTVITNTASLTSTQIPTPALSSATITVARAADLRITKSVMPALPSPGDTVTYTLTFTNDGPHTATGVVITDTIPVSITNTSVISSGVAITDTGASPGYVWSVQDPGVGQSGTITITGRLSDTLPIGHIFTNTARITTTAIDTNAGNNSNSASTTVYAYVRLPLVFHNYLVAPDLVVQSVTATRNSVQVVVKNEGNGPVSDEFWVQVYIDPDPIPTGVNQLWYDLGDEGMLWGVTSAALPLAPGDTITLTYGDVYYRPSLSRFYKSLAAGTPVYAQVDAWNGATTYGAILETHEITGDTYNNISGPFYRTAIP